MYESDDGSLVLLNSKIKTLIVIFSMLVFSVLCVGCHFEKRDRVRDVGVVETITENDRMAVLSTEIEEGSVTVTISVDFDTLKLQDFEEIYITKNEAGSNIIKCDIAHSRCLNGEEIFNETFKGNAKLYFKDESVLSSDVPSEYYICFTLGHTDGTASMYKFLLG